MSKSDKVKAPKGKESSGVYMKSDIVDQSNIIQQSNMACCVYSVITQSFSSVKVNNA